MKNEMKREGKMADLQVAFDMVDGESMNVHSLQDPLRRSPSKKQKNTIKEEAKYNSIGAKRGGRNGDPLAG